MDNVIKTSYFGDGTFEEVDTSFGDELLALTSEIVASHVSNNATESHELPALIKSVHETLSSLSYQDKASRNRQEPAVSIEESITDDYIICLEDGKKLKMLKRHLRTAYGMSPDDYRARWGLSADYPMVAPNYAKQRSSLAKTIGLGTRPRGEKKAA